MKKLLLAAAFLLAGSAQAANAPVNIAYPINGGSVNNYFHSYFTTTCSGGSYTVKWLVDGVLVGSSTFYDTASVQFANKLPTGWHVLQVFSSCGQDTVKFYVN